MRLTSPSSLLSNPDTPSRRIGARFLGHTTEDGRCMANRPRPAADIVERFNQRDGPLGDDQIPNRSSAHWKMATEAVRTNNFEFPGSWKTQLEQRHPALSV
jgi:hypothetical protein